MHFFRIKLFSHGSVIGHVSKEHGHQFAFSFNGASIVKDFIGQEFGGVRLGLIIIDGWDIFGPAEIMAASITKAAGRWIYLSTFWAGEFQILTTPVAKPSVFRIFGLAFWAFHFFTFNMRLIMKRLVASDHWTMRMHQEA